MNMQKIGAYAFLLGILISIIFGLIPSFQNSTWLLPVLVILGIVVGLLNITDKDVNSFLLATIAFIVTSSSINSLPILGEIFRDILKNLIHFVSPAALIVSIVAIIRVSNTK